LRGDPVADPSARGPLRTYFWAGHRNFGDRLTLVLLQKLGIEATWAPAKEAEFVGCGSVLSHLPRGWNGTVWGTGKARKSDKVDLSRATVLALRGKLSAVGIAGSYTLGDPGLLANLLAEPTGEVPLGIVPHWEDHTLSRKWKGEVIDVTADPLDVVRHIARCQRIVSSSLHGLIVADALGIPRRWEVFAKIQGNGFKFRDHGTVVGAFEPQVWNPVPKVRQVQDDLRAALERGCLA
jgi:pyruvyltransferase